MALDTLEIFGTEYTNVAGFKATDDNDQIKTYVRPQGTKSITSNGTNIDVTNYAAVNVAVSGGTSAIFDVIEQLPGGGDHHIITGVDISTDTVTAEHLEYGYTAHDSSGNAVVGTMTTPTVSLQSKTTSYTPSTSAQTGTITADSGYNGLSSVAITVNAIPS